MTQEYSENSPATRIAKVVNDGKLDGYEIVFLDDAVSTKHVFLEPISWSAAAMSIASGALSWLGTKAMERVSGEVTLEQLQQDTVEKFSRVLSKRLEEEALRKANAELKALERNIPAYPVGP